jgi:UrcA family protein
MHRFIPPAALAIAMFGGVVHAQTAGPSYQAPVPAQLVRFGDLDTSTSVGAQRLAFRLRVAARSVCGGDSPAVRSGDGFQACVRTALEQAAVRINRPMVTEALNLTPTSLFAGR